MSHSQEDSVSIRLCEEGGICGEGWRPRAGVSSDQRQVEPSRSQSMLVEVR